MERIWHKIYGSDIPSEIDHRRYRSVAQLIQEAVEQYAHLPAFVGLGGELAYQDVDRLSRQFAAYLQGELGIKKGDRVALMSPNILAFPVAMFGIIRAGAVQVNVNPLYTAHELAHQLVDADVDTVIVFSGATNTLVEAMESVSIRHVVVAEAGDLGDSPSPRSPLPRELTKFTWFSDAIDAGAGLVFEPVDLNHDDLIYLQYTGGTTGVPKGAALSHGNLIANILQFKSFAPRIFGEGRDLVITALPLYHIFALMVNCLSFFSAGAKNVLVANPRDIDSLVATFERHRFSIVTGVNTLFANLMAHPRIHQIDFSSLRLALGGGSAILKGTSDKWHSLTGQHIKEGFGMSETSPIVTLNPLHLEDFSETVGIPLPSTDVSLRDDDGHEVGIGEPGELCVRGPQVMRGYWRREEDNATSFWADCFLRTGDIAICDANGFIKIVDRRKDMVLVSGFNVFPNEIEAAVASCPGVLESASVGVPDGKTGEAVHLFVVKEPHAELTEEQIREHCRARLAAYKQPKFVEFVSELPKSAVGKTLRRALRSSTTGIET
ncbi:AMP-binding protein [Ralstonia pseudosolanacearum]|uniref:AMP-binding protein n=1 Tax=Ralstonia pseudosolanacearum TaxID=1310165 RepID=UPI000DADA4F4|nr:AMP-binding protein [Ralstonia pseudosolanacearum]RAA06460.1 long-chain-fatty-acid--CoA ligase [Ralstonia pseudosolanacearum]